MRSFFKLLLLKVFALGFSSAYAAPECHSFYVESLHSALVAHKAKVTLELLKFSEDDFEKLGLNVVSESLSPNNSVDVTDF